MLKKEYFAKILVVSGIATLLSYIVNLICLVIPFQFNVPKWVFLISQDISEKSVFPILGILALVGGTYLCNLAKENKETRCKCAVWAERLSAVLSSLLFAGLVTIAVVYALNINPLYKEVKTQIQGEADKVRSQLTMMMQSNPQIQPGNLQRGMQELDKRAGMELKKAKKDIMVNSVKILFGLISFAIAYLVSAIYLFKLSSIENKDQCA